MKMVKFSFYHFSLLTWIQNKEKIRTTVFIHTCIIPWVSGSALSGTTEKMQRRQQQRQKILLLLWYRLINFGLFFNNVAEANSKKLTAPLSVSLRTPGCTGNLHEDAISLTSSSTSSTLQRVIRHWKGLPRQVWSSPSWRCSRNDFMALSTLGWVTRWGFGHRLDSMVLKWFWNSAQLTEVPLQTLFAENLDVLVPTTSNARKFLKRIGCFL